ncbi:hypothetical protein CTI12_AA538880 [Artemisia annua]|uniref:Uncharacterized protein n=1 Tax=Artemisia annua TaxID=35608 RepID=A0A2U1L287_ARTAN|nr:hypothetical protein CTI12_AA538880 [Artemisia annua]
MATIADAVRLAQVVNEIQHVENELRQRLRILTEFFWRRRFPANPAAPLPARIQPGSIDHVPFPTVGTCLGASLAPYPIME